MIREGGRTEAVNHAIAQRAGAVGVRLERFSIIANRLLLDWDSQDVANERVSTNHRFAGSKCLAPILLICVSVLLMP
jgi:hypothetical protein